MFCYLLVNQFKIFKNDYYPKERKTRDVLIIRGFLASVSATLYYLSARSTPIEVFSVIARLNAILVAFFNFFILGHKVKPSVIAACFLAFTGLYLILDPKLMILSGKKFQGDVTLFGFIMCLSYLLSISISRIYLIKVSNLLTNFNNIFYVNMALLIFGCLNSVISNEKIFDEQFFELKNFFVVILNSVSSFFVQYCMASAFRLEKDGTKVNLLVNSQILISYFIDIVFLKSEFVFLRVCGAILVLSCIFFILINK